MRLPPFSVRHTGPMRDKEIPERGPMAHVISFRTSFFDPTGEPENPYNPIAGQSALVWLRASVLEDTDQTSEPDCEDWGWYIEVQVDEATYTVGAICFLEEDEPVSDPLDWMIQVVKHRSFTDALRRKNAMVADDPLTQTIYGALESNPAFEDVQLEVGK